MNTKEYIKSLIVAKQFESALEIIKFEFTRNPNDSDLHFLAGNTFFDIENYQEAIYHYSAAISTNNTSASIFQNRGHAYLMCKKFKSAIEDYTSVISLTPKSDIYLNRGALWDEIGEFDNALHDFQMAIEIDPDYHLAHMNIGNILGKKKCYQDAIAAYEKAIRLKPDFSEIYYNRAVLWNDLGELENAEKDLAEALKFDSHNGDVYFGLGVLLQKKGDYISSIRHFRRSVKLNARETTQLLAIFSDTYPSPFLLKRLCLSTKYPHLIKINKLANSIQLCKKWDLVIKYFSYDNEFLLKELNAYVSFWMGDPMETLRLIKEIRNTKNSTTPRLLYYLLQSSSDFLEPLRIDSTELDKIFAELDNNDIVGKYYYAKILFLSNRAQDSLNIIDTINSYLPALVLKSQILSSDGDFEKKYELAEEIAQLLGNNSSNLHIYLNPQITISDYNSIDEFLTEFSNKMIGLELIGELNQIQEILAMPVLDYCEFYNAPLLDSKFFEILNSKFRDIELSDLKQEFIKTIRLSLLIKNSSLIYNDIFTNLGAQIEFFQITSAIEQKPLNLTVDEIIALFIHKMKIDSKWYVSIVNYFYLQNRISLDEVLYLYTYIIKISKMGSDSKLLTDSIGGNFPNPFDIIKIPGISFQKVFQYTMKIIYLFGLDLKIDMPDDNSQDYAYFKENFLQNFGFLFALVNRDLISPAVADLPH